MVSKPTVSRAPRDATRESSGGSGVQTANHPKVRSRACLVYNYEVYLIVQRQGLTQGNAMPLSPFAFALLPPLTIMTIDVDRTHSTFDWVCSAYMRYGLPLLKRNTRRSAYCSVTVQSTDCFARTSCFRLFAHFQLFELHFIAPCINLVCKK